ncbi:MAG: glutamate racemase, partial [Anaerolineales bacterium]
QNIDTVVLGCTHYPFVIALIQHIVGENVRVIDPAPAVARQALRLLDGSNLRRQPGSLGQLQFFTSGPAASLDLLLPRLLGEVGPVTSLQWESDRTLQEPLLSGD